MENLRIFTAKHSKVCELFDLLSEKNEDDELNLEEELEKIENKLDEVNDTFNYSKMNNSNLDKCWHELKKMAITADIDIDELFEDE